MIPDGLTSQKEYWITVSRAQRKPPEGFKPGNDKIQDTPRIKCEPGVGSRRAQTRVSSWTAEIGILSSPADPRQATLKLEAETSDAGSGRVPAASGRPAPSSSPAAESPCASTPGALRLLWRTTDHPSEGPRHLSRSSPGPGRGPRRGRPSEAEPRARGPPGGRLRAPPARAGPRR